MRTAVLGASGLVGRKMLDLLESCSWLDGNPQLLTSARSAGTEISFRGRILVCREVTAAAFTGLDLALFSAGGQTSRQWAPVATQAGCVVVDNSSAWRRENQIPLVVPEINGTLVPTHTGIIANPNCSTIQIAMAVAPLDQVFGVRECHVTTLQAVSGAGQEAVSELLRQTRDFPEDSENQELFSRPMAFNILPAIGKETEAGGFEEESKVEYEMRRILGRDKDLHITCTATRVPVITGHCAAVRLVCQRPVTPAEAVEALERFPGIQVTKGGQNFHTPREIAGENDVFVSRLRQDPGCDRSLLMWVVADNLLKGAAWNAVQIATLLAEERAR